MKNIKYKGLEVKTLPKWVPCSLLRGIYHGGKIYVNSRLKEGELQKVMEHEYLHSVFLTNYPRLRFINRHRIILAGVCLMIYFYTSLFDELALSLFGILTVLTIADESIAHYKTKDLWLGLMRISYLILFFTLVVHLKYPLFPWL